MSSPRTYYALLDVGIFEEWSELEEQIKGMRSPVFKSFRTYSAAEAFLADPTFASGDLVNPFGFAGPVTIAPTPANKLGQPAKVAKVPRKFHRPAASLSAPSSSNPPSSSRSRSHSIPSTAVAGPSTSSAGASPPAPLSGASPAPSIRKRSPLIQSVVEEEEERDIVTPPPSSDGHSTIHSRSRAGSVCSSAPSSKTRKPLLSIFALSSSSTTPSNPPALSSVSSFSSTESHGPRTPPASPDHPKRFSIRRQSSICSTDSPPPSSYSARPIKSPNRPNSVHSLWGDAYMDPPKALPLHPTPNTAESVPFDPTSPFTYEAPVFSRRLSSSSSSSRNSIVLPLRSPSSSNPPSLKRQQSNLSLRSTTSLSSITSDLGPLRPPRMSRFGSSSSSGSFESLPEEAKKPARPAMHPPSVSAPAVATSSLSQGWEAMESNVAGAESWKQEVPAAVKKEKKGGWKGKMKKLFGAA